jgi:hypothetical protein
MKELIDYILAHTVRGECKCGQCADVGNKPDPNGHTANLVFFKVATRDNPERQRFEELTRAHENGEFSNVNPFDGKEHNYIELGAWIGDQGLAMQYMGLGVLLGSFNLLSPQTVLHIPDDDPVVMQMAGMGLLAVQKVTA